MSIANEINVAVGTVAIVKIGRNEVEVTVTEVTANGWKVKSQMTRSIAHVAPPVRRKMNFQLTFFKFFL